MNENYIFIKVDNSQILEKFTTKYETKNDLEKAEIKVYISKKSEFKTFDELEDKSKIEFKPYEIKNEDNYFYSYHSSSKLNDDEILLFKFENINNKDSTMNFIVAEGELFYNEKTINNKTELTFEKDINYYLFKLPKSSFINYLLKYKNDLNPNIYYANMENERFDLKKIEQKTKDDNNYIYFYTKRNKSDDSNLYLIIYNNDNNTLNNNKIDISINEHDLYSYEIMNIQSSKTLKINNEEKIIVIGDLDYNNTFHIKIIHKNIEDILITSILFNKKKNEIYEIDNEKSLNFTSQLKLEDNINLYYNSLGNEFTQGNQSIMFIFNTKMNLDISIESLKNDESKSDIIKANEYEEKKIKIEQKQNLYIIYNISNLESSKDIYYEFSSKKNSFYSTDIYYYVDNNFTNTYLLDYKNLTTCKSKEENNILVIYCNYTKKENDTEIGFMIFMNENSEINIYNTKTNRYIPKIEDETSSRNKPPTKIFIIIGVIILVIIAIIIIICFVKDEQIDSSIIENIDPIS